MPRDTTKVRVRPRGRKPVKLPRGASPEDAYFYTKEWQKKEREADRDIAAGRVSGPYRGAKETIAALHAAAGRSKRRSSPKHARR